MRGFWARFCVCLLLVFGSTAGLCTAETMYFPLFFSIAGFETTISLTISESTDEPVTVSLFDINGNLVNAKELFLAKSINSTFDIGDLFPNIDHFGSVMIQSQVDISGVAGIAGPQGDYVMMGGKTTSGTAMTIPLFEVSATLDTILAVFNPNDTVEVVDITGHSNGLEISVERLIPGKSSLITLISDLFPFDGRGSLRITSGNPVAAVAVFFDIDRGMINSIEPDVFFATKNP